VTCAYSIEDLAAYVERRHAIMRWKRLRVAMVLSVVFLPVVCKNYYSCSPLPDMPSVVEPGDRPLAQTAIAGWTAAPEGVQTEQVPLIKTAVAAWTAVPAVEEQE